MKMYNAALWSTLLISSYMQSADTVAAQQLLNDRLKSCFSNLQIGDADQIYGEVKMLFAYGADPNTPIYGGESMLFNLILADASRYETVIDLFLQHPHTTVNQGDRNNYTPLMAAIYCPVVLKRLLDHRDIRIDAKRSYDERTAIDFAIEGKQVKSVELLLKSGACIDHHNSLGLTPFLRVYRPMHEEAFISGKMSDPDLAAAIQHK